MNKPLAGKHAVITGGSRGIGASIALTLAREGAQVTLLGRTAATLLAQADRIRGEIPDAMVQYIVIDLADGGSIDAAFRSSEKTFGAVGLLINNAGHAASAAIGKTSAALWQEMLTVNLTSTFLCIQAVLPAMRKYGYGRIVNIASTAGLVGYRYVAAYCAAKHGVVGLTRAIALEVAAENITVNAVCPGYTDTDMVTDAVANIATKTGREEATVRAQLAAGNPQGRLVRPEEVANTVRWLCLPGSEAVNGQAISVSGGEVM